MIYFTSNSNVTITLYTRISNNKDIRWAWTYIQIQDAMIRKHLKWKEPNSEATSSTSYVPFFSLSMVEQFSHWCMPGTNTLFYYINVL